MNFLILSSSTSWSRLLSTEFLIFTIFKVYLQISCPDLDTSTSEHRSRSPSPPSNRPLSLHSSCVKFPVPLLSHPFEWHFVFNKYNDINSNKFICTKTGKAKLLYKSWILILKVGNRTIISMNVNMISDSKT